VKDTIYYLSIYFNWIKCSCHIILVTKIRKGAYSSLVVP